MKINNIFIVTDVYILRKLIFLLITVLPLLSCSDSPVDLSAYQGINYISALPFDAGVETNWARTDATGTYLDFTVIAPSTTTGLPTSTTDYARLDLLNLITDGGFEGGTGTWANTGGSIAVASDADSINPGNNSLEFIDTQRVIFNLNTLSGAASNTEYVIHYKFNKSTAGTVTFDYHDNATSSYLSTPWNPSTSASYSSTDFPTSSGENNIVEIENIADDHYFSIGEYNGTALQTGHIDDIKVVRNDISLNLGTTVPYTASGRPELISGTYRFSIYIKKEIAANINPATANRFPSDYVTLYINNNPTAVDISSVTDASWVQISAEYFIQINENDTISLAVTPNNSTNPALKEAGSILIAAPALYYLSD